MKITIPASLKSEHRELHAELARAVRTPGPIGRAAEAVAELLHPHFVKEEQYALPPIGLLKALAEGKANEDMREVLVMTDRLKKDLPDMIKEHKAVVAALKDLVAAAKMEKRDDIVHFTEKLMLHAKTEEDVLYPAAILAGEYVKVRLGK